MPRSLGRGREEVRGGALVPGRPPTLALQARRVGWGGRKRKTHWGGGGRGLPQRRHRLVQRVAPLVVDGAHLPRTNQERIKGVLNDDARIQGKPGGFYISIGLSYGFSGIP